MNRPLTLAVLLLALLPSAGALAQAGADYPEDLATWEPVAMPTKAAVADRRVWLSAANGSRLEWQVRREGAQVKATPFDWSLHEAETAVLLPFVPKVEQYRGAQRARKVSDGWLVAFNRGEWGGALYWFSADGGKNYKVSDHQVVDFFLVGGRLHAIEGLAHMVLSQGSVIAIDRVAGRWQAAAAQALPAAPYAVTLAEDGAAYIVLSNAVVALRFGRLETIIDETSWDSLYPNSATLGADGSLYVGMRQFVGRVELADRSLTFLVPERLALHRLPIDQEQRIRQQAEGH